MNAVILNILQLESEGKKYEKRKHLRNIMWCRGVYAYIMFEWL